MLNVCHVAEQTPASLEKTLQHRCRKMRGTRRYWRLQGTRRYLLWYWRYKEVSLHGNCPGEVNSEVSRTNMEWDICRIYHTPPKEYVLISFPSIHQLPFMKNSEWSRGSVHGVGYKVAFLIPTTAQRGRCYPFFQVRKLRFGGIHARSLIHHWQRSFQL